MKEIKITGSRKPLLIDDEDMPFVQQRQWCVNKDGNGYKAVHCRKGALARMLLAVTDKQLRVTHRNNNFLDCTRDNLLIVDLASYGQRRRKAPRRYTSNYKGVATYGARWRAYVTIRKQRMHLGYFNTEIEAARAYNEAVEKVFGHLALRNNV